MQCTKKKCQLKMKKRNEKNGNACSEKQQSGNLKGGKCLFKHKNERIRLKCQHKTR